MKKTEAGKYSLNNIEKVEGYILDNLNADEIARLTDRLIIRGFITLRSLGNLIKVS